MCIYQYNTIQEAGEIIMYYCRPMLLKHDKLVEYNSCYKVQGETKLILGNMHEHCNERVKARMQPMKRKEKLSVNIVLQH